jgi:hypothetical protein
MTRAAIYARYTDTQPALSTDEQIRICGTHADRSGWRVVDVARDEVQRSSIHHDQHPQSDTD